MMSVFGRIQNTARTPLLASVRSGWVRTAGVFLPSHHSYKGVQKMSMLSCVRSAGSSGGKGVRASVTALSVAGALVAGVACVPAASASPAAAKEAVGVVSAATPTDGQLRAAMDEALRAQGVAAPTHAPAPELKGAKGAAAKAAIKAAIKALSKLGKSAWDKAISKLPLPGAVKKYLGYESVMKALNVAVDFEGEVTDNIQKGLESIGVPGWAAGPAARAIVLVLL